MDIARYGFDETRLGKRIALLERGLNPYPHSFAAPEEVRTVLQRAAEAEAAGGAAVVAATVCGRLWGKRGMGKSVFMDLRDSSGRIQLYLQFGSVPQETWDLVPLLDLGDIVGISGNVFRTRAGELTIKVEGLTVLAKSVVPIPMGKETEDKVFYRMTDTEAKYRERYLNWLLDEEDRKRVVQRSRIISLIRRHMEDAGFLEVSTPTIEFVYGGAEARPFETSIWALGHKKAFLRISPELYLKRYVVGGFPKVFSICQNFRNEGIDHSHNPEFTMMEWYEACTDYRDQMKRFEDLVAGLCQAVHGGTKITYQGTEIDFTPPWRRLTVLDGLREYGGLDAGAMSVAQLRDELARRGLPFREPLSWGLATATLFEAVCEEHLVQPTFVLDHPLEISPLTKVHRSDPRLVERFEPYACRMEIGNAYSELTDPVDQLQRLEGQRQGTGGDDFGVHPVDADFVKAIGCGMPPTGGAGIGIDRIIMLLTDAPSIRDIIPFPMYKPK